MDQTKKAPGKAKELGEGVKDKFTGDYIDGPKELAKGLLNDPAGTGKSALSGAWNEATKPFQDAKQACDAAGSGALGGTTCVLGWGNAVINYPNQVIASQIVDDDVRESVQNGQLPRAFGQGLYNGVTTAVPFLKPAKILKTIGKTGQKKTKTGANGTQGDTRKACRTHSFLPGTPVLLANGTRKPIEQIRTGEKVLATNPVNGLTAPRTVTDTITTENDKHFTRLTVRVKGRPYTITATDTHPFWLADQHRWTDTSDIRPGNQLRTPEGRTLSVTQVSHYTKQHRTHDLTIRGIHTYYVLAGETPVLVHNSNDNCPAGVGNPDAPEPLGRGSTGDSTPRSLKEQIAMKQAMSDPASGFVVPLKKGMTDHRWEGGDGWQKMSRNIDGIEIHYVYNPRTGQVDDYKFKR